MKRERKLKDNIYIVYVCHNRQFGCSPLLYSAAGEALLAIIDSNFNYDIWNNGPITWYKFFNTLTGEELELGEIWIC